MIALVMASAVAAQPADPQSGDIVFSAQQDGNIDIYSRRPDGTGILRLTDGAGFETDPIWSPGGEWIAFESTGEGSSDIFVMQNDNSEQRNMTSTPMDESDPAWSPDSRQIVYVSGYSNLLDDGGATQIMIMSAAGGDAWTLVDNGAINTSPAWSPDGSAIVFVSDISGAPQLYTIGFGGAASASWRPWMA